MKPKTSFLCALFLVIGCYGCTGLNFNLLQKNKVEIKKTYYPDGKIKQEFRLVNGLREGTYKYYFKNGHLKGTGNFIHEKLNGEHKTFYKNGMLEGIIYFKDDVPQGKVVRFYKNGNKRSDALYENGNNKNDMRDGHYKVYFESGVLKEVRRCI